MVRQISESFIYHSKHFLAPIQTKPPPTTTQLPFGYCPNPEPLHNGYFFAVRIGESDMYQPGDRIYFLCNIRYRLIGPHHRECGSNLKWDADHPYCQSNLNFFLRNSIFLSRVFFFFFIKMKKIPIYD